jgi:hypothetical protein
LAAFAPVPTNRNQKIKSQPVGKILNSIFMPVGRIFLKLRFCKKNRRRKIIKTKEI